jgi:hypothetical protein
MEKTAEPPSGKPPLRRMRKAWLLLTATALIIGGWAFFVVGETRMLPTVALPDGTKARVRFGTRGVPDKQNWRSFPHHTDAYRFTSSPPDRWRWCKDRWNDIYGHLPDWVKAKTKAFPKAVTNSWSAGDPYELLFEVTSEDAGKWPWTVYAIDDFGVRTLLSRIHDPFSARGLEMEEGWNAVGQCGPLPTQTRKLRLQIERGKPASDTTPGPVVAELVIANPFLTRQRLEPTGLRNARPLEGSSKITLEQAAPKRGSVNYPWERAEFELRLREEPWASPEEGHHLCAASIQNAEGGWDRVELVAADIRPSEKLHIVTCRARAWPSDGPWRFRTWWFPAWTEARPPVPSFTYVKLPVPKSGQTMAVGQTSSSGGADLKLASVRGGDADDAFYAGWKLPLVTFWLSGWHPPIGKPLRVWLVRDSKGRTVHPGTGLPFEMREIDMDERRGYRCALKLPEDAEWFDIHLTSAAPTMIELEVMPDTPK